MESNKNNQPGDVEVGNIKPNSWLKSTWKYVSGLIIILILVGFILIFTIINNQPKEGACSSKQSTSLLNQATTDITSNNVFKLGQISTQIQQKKNYQADPSCLYIETEYAIITSNPTLSQQDYNQLITLLNNNNQLKLSNIITNNDQLPSLSTLKEEVSFLRSYQKNVRIASEGYYVSKH